MSVITGEKAKRADAAPSRAAQPRRVGRPSAREAENKHLAMLEAALEEFSRHGFHGASVRAIAERAGLSTRTLYNRYADKASLFAASLEMSALNDTWKPSETRGTLREELIEFALHLLQRYIQDRQVRLARVIFRECISFPQLEGISRRQFERFQLTPTSQILIRHGIAESKARDLAIAYNSLTFYRWQNRVIYDEPALPAAELTRFIETATDLFLSGAVAVGRP